MSKLYVRDDDVSYFTTAEDIYSAYGKAFAKGPISFAIIPFAVETWNYGDPEAFRQDTSKTYPIHLNVDLTNYIRDLIRRGRAYVMLHGYSHIYYPCFDTGKPYQVPEFKNFQLNFEKLLIEGRQYLEDTFSQRVNWFIPPSNALCSSSYQACQRLGFNLPYVFPVRKRLMTLRLINAYLRMKIAEKLKTSARLKLETHTEVPCYGLTKSTDFMQFNKYLSKTESVIFTHYWEVNKFNRVREALDQILSRSTELGSFDELK